MLRDYELALSNYRLLATDYKLDKAWKRFAGVQVNDSFLLVFLVYSCLVSELVVEPWLGLVFGRNIRTMCRPS
jgi:hypothetical protein